MSATNPGHRRANPRAARERSAALATEEYLRGYEATLAARDALGNPRTTLPGLSAADVDAIVAMLGEE